MPATPKPPAHTGVTESTVADEDRLGTSAPADDLDKLLPHAPSGPVALSGDPRTDARASLSDDALGDA